MPALLRHLCYFYIIRFLGRVYHFTLLICYRCSFIFSFLELIKKLIEAKSFAHCSLLNGFWLIGCYFASLLFYLLLDTFCCLLVTFCSLLFTFLSILCDESIIQIYKESALINYNNYKVRSSI